MNQIQFQALVVSKNDDGSYSRRLQWRTLDDLPAGDVVIKVDFSSLNYKDALSASGNRGVTRRYPHTPGVDAVGHVFSSTVAAFAPGATVLCMGYDLGMNTSGGFSRYISVPADWVMALPSGLTPLESMQIGTAGFTAAQCVYSLIEGGVTPDDGPILVTGATGGVGSLSVRLLASLHYEVTAITGKADQHSFLMDIGATQVLDRNKFLTGKKKLLLRERWAGVVDTVGGEYLATAIKGTCYDGVVTSCGNAASGDLPLSVYPFILRGVTLCGIDSAKCRMSRRAMIWNRLADSWRFTGLNSLCKVVGLDKISSEIDLMLAGRTKGRVVLDLQETA